MKYIYLSGKVADGKRVIVDDNMYDDLSRYKWHLSYGYAIRGSMHRGKRTKLLMHRYINKTPGHMGTDHINGNKLDNRKCNLRSVTPSQNQRNISWWRSNTTGYRGVQISHRKSNPYRAVIYIDGKRISLGNFPTAIEASNAYSSAARIYHGEFSYINRSVI